MTADVPNSEEVIRLARELNPRISVLARTAHLRDAEALRRAGAQTVFSGEGEVALALIEDVLRRLGATPDQIDRERERVHGELQELRIKNVVARFVRARAPGASRLPLSFDFLRQLEGIGLLELRQEELDRERTAIALFRELAKNPVQRR